MELESNKNKTNDVKRFFVYCRTLDIQFRDSIKIDCVGLKRIRFHFRFHMTTCALELSTGNIGCPDTFLIPILGGIGARQALRPQFAERILLQMP